jgi:dihydrodipicolinate synthase/N-acetylneuraminate lyase
MVAVHNALGDRLTYLGGLPTAEVYAAAYLALGVPTYSSAVFNFIPRTALEFHKAVIARDEATIGRLLRDFCFPYLCIRNRQPGYAVSIVKAGAAIAGHGGAGALAAQQPDGSGSGPAAAVDRGAGPAGVMRQAGPGNSPGPAFQRTGARM